MTTVACIVRQSQGSDDSVSLEQQRDATRELAAELGDADPEMIDLGNHTGFSLFVKTPEQESLDTNPRIRTLETGLRDGAWDYLVAYDDTRLSRDQYYWALQHYALRGGVDIEFVADVPDDQLTFRVQRAVEAEVKRKEIRKVRQAIEHRQEQGMYQGTAPFGLRFDADGEYLERHPDEWPALVDIFRGIGGDQTYAEIVADVDGLETKSAISKIKDKRETYQEFGLADEL